ncbi:MAG TPA: hypothetical protein VGG57_11430 [Stellaceae bacterium]|jgi:hypothetical protein
MDQMKSIPNHGNATASHGVRGFGDVPRDFAQRDAMKIIMAAVAVGLVVGVSSGAMAQYRCPAGYVYSGGGMCQWGGGPAPGGYSNPASGAVNGEAAGAASGYAAGGPVGAIVGGAVGTATGAVTGAANTATGVVNGTAGAVSGCAVGYHLYNGYCYPN